MSDLRGKLFTALTGRDADVSGQAGGDLRGMLMAVGGASRRTKSGIDLTKAAKSLGVSRRTVERWVKTEQTSAGQRPSIACGAMRANSTTSSATRPCPRLISSSASSLLPSPDSPEISTPMPSTSISTPCMVQVFAIALDRYTRRNSMTRAAGSGVPSTGRPPIDARSSSSFEAGKPSAMMIAGGPLASSSSLSAAQRSAPMRRE